MKRANVVYIMVIIILILSGCNLSNDFESKIYFDEFEVYKDKLEEIANLGLDLYRTENNETRVFIYFSNNNVGGYVSKSDVDEEIEVNKELELMLLSLTKSDIPCQLEYIIIGNTYVTFTREGIAYAIMYSEDSVEPQGVWKYNKEDLQIDKFEEKWYELKAHGLGVTP